MLTVVQPYSGYRFAIDAILLAHFARPPQRARVLELGAGCGVVSLVLAAMHHPTQVDAVELQPRLAELITRNAVLNRISAVRAICADLRRVIPELAQAGFDYVVANPPYRATRRGRESPDQERWIARGGGGATLAEFIAAAVRHARHGGKVAMVFTASRTAELIAELKQRSLEPKRLRFVHARPGEAATMVLVEARKGAGIEVAVEPPLFIHTSPGAYSDEVRAMLTGMHMARLG